MTLCAAWIRHGKNDEGDELVFATDSRLGGGEAWDTGQKLFDLGRQDALLCFAGATNRAYPLILHGGNLQSFNVTWNDPRLDIFDVLDTLCNLFTEICQRIDTTGLSAGAPQPLTDDDEVNFLFGGWSWRQKRFGLWKINYNIEIKAFVPVTLHESEDEVIFTFMGCEIEGAPEKAKDLLEKELISSGRVFRKILDMEPLRVLARMIEDNNYPSIGGSLQIAKVYQSGLHEFFGVRMPSGKMSILGRDVNPYDAPPIRFMDFQTGDLIDDLPVEFRDLQNYEFGVDTKFVRDCYPNGRLKSSMPEAHCKRLHRILKDIAYSDFVKQREEASISVSAEQPISSFENSGADGAVNE